MNNVDRWQPDNWNCCSDYMDDMPQGCEVNLLFYQWCPCKEWMERKNGLKARFNYGYVVEKKHYE